MCYFVEMQLPSSQVSDLPWVRANIVRFTSAFLVGSACGREHLKCAGSFNSSCWISGYSLAEVYIICIAVDTFLSMLSISRAHILALSLLSM